ncbi:MAG: GIY-YIG nuclease family protein [Candidatus Paceibacterota bacterium]|jgi:excinuclease ABC subunit C
MQSQYLTKYKLPDGPGIYRFLKGRHILYIGKATSLKDRVRSYFAGDLGDTRGPMLVKMLAEADNLTWESTNSVLEALILESALIKKHQPKYNSREKDDKSYNYIVITKEKWPRVLIVRGRDLLNLNTDKNVRHRMSNIKYNILNTTYTSYGPFPAGKELKVALNLIRKIFPFRDGCLPYEVLPSRRTFVVKKVQGSSKTFEGLPYEGDKSEKPRGCFNRQLGLCPGVCTGEITARDYGKIIVRLKMFFSGQVTGLRAKLEKEMKTYAQKQEFEQAGEIKKELFALNHIQDVALIGNEKKPGISSICFEAYDIAHLSGADTVGAMTVWQDGELKPANYRKFKIKRLKKGEVDDLKNLAEILERRLAHPEWSEPDVVVVDGDERIRQVAIKIIESAGFRAKVIAVTKNKQHKAEKLLGDSAIVRDYHRAIVAVNAEAHRFAIAFHRQKRAKNFRKI